VIKSIEVKKDSFGEDRGDIEIGGIEGFRRKIKATEVCLMRSELEKNRGFWLVFLRILSKYEKNLSSDLILKRKY
jgi:superfamily I DNA and/or RNA helicase